MSHIADGLPEEHEEYWPFNDDYKEGVTMD